MFKLKINYIKWAKWLNNIRNLKKSIFYLEKVQIGQSKAVIPLNEDKINIFYIKSST